MKKTIALCLLTMLIFSSTACSSAASNQVAAVAAPAVSTENSTSMVDDAGSSPDDSAQADSGENPESMATITLNGDSITVDGTGASAEGSIVTITSAGSYAISGTLTDGQILVNSEDEGEVELVLNGVDITNSTSAPIFILAAEDAVITLADGSTNTVTDGSSYVFEDEDSDEPNAAIFSKSDLTIEGNGSLTVNANYNNGIASKDDLKIKSGILTVKAVNDGIKGKDSVEIKDGILTVTSGADGIQSTNANDAEKGYVSIQGGTINITSDLDGIQAETNLTISAGTLNITTGGGSVNASSNEGWGNSGGDRGGMGMQTTSDDSTTESMKALKAGLALTISGGSITIDSADDALHSNDTLTIDSGDFSIASGDDGMHADTSLTINDGNIVISKSYEGIESAAITLNGGSIDIFASDDGINVAGGNDGSAMGGRPGQNDFNTSGSYNLTINGGSLVVNASGDGLDSNGTISMTDGKVIVYGPTNSGNGALDYMGSFTITGGTIVAVGSSGMAQSASDSSTQYSLLYNYTESQPAGTMLHIETADGEEILTLVPTKEYQSVMFSSADLQNGVTYNLYAGGSSSGTPVDGLITDGTYSAGDLVTSFTISSIVTIEGAAGNMMGGRGGPGGGMQPPGQ